MNVLITSAGRRTSLLMAFKKAVLQRNGTVLAGDIDGLAPSLFMADDVIRLPRVTEKFYVDCLLELVKKKSIKLIVPTIDTELPILAAKKKDFNKLGCMLATSDLNMINICQDKWQTVCNFSRIGIRVPASWLPYKYDDAPEEVFIKPRNGSASINTFRTTKKELAQMITRVPNAIIQEYLPFSEVTIDALFDFSGNIIHYVPRRRIRTIGGESIQGVTISDDSNRTFLLELFKQISLLGGRGPVTVQVFLGPEGPILSEINPRFGGGFPLGLAAGGNYPEWLLQMIEGRKVESKIGEYQTGLYMTRYYSEIITETPFWR